MRVIVQPSSSLRQRPQSGTTVESVERACGRVAVALDQLGRDEIALLRLARVLKGINRDLKTMLQRRIAARGRSAQTEHAERMLGSMEENLRAVLLDTTALGRLQIRNRLSESLDAAHGLLEVVAAP
jgi:hypothetical protein